MISRIIKYNLERPFLALCIVVGLIVGGFYSYRELPIDAIPDITNVQVQVLTSAPGLSPLEVERLVTRPVEIALTGIPGVEAMRSVSRSAVSAVTLIFEDSTDLYRARQLVDQRLPDARAVIPPDAGRPSLGPLTTGLGEIYHFTLDWPGHSTVEIRTLFDWEIAPRLRTVPGVVEVNAWGGDTRQIQVRLREAAMLAAAITPNMVETAVLGSGRTASAGFIQRDEEGTFVRAEASYKTLEDIAQQVVATRDGRPILVGDVADVVDAAAPRFAAATMNGKSETVYAMAQMIANGNAHKVVGQVKQRLEEIRRSLPNDYKIEPFYDRADFVSQVLGTVQKNLAEGGLVVAVVLLWILGSWRAGLLVASLIPLSMLGTFVLMRASGVSGNLLSLGAIDFGLVVDGAVVLVEGTMAAMFAAKAGTRAAIGQVADESGRSVMMAVIIVAIVYVPVLLLVGIEGKMFQPMALTVLFALGTALVLTFTWIPAAGRLFLKLPKHHEPRLLTLLRARTLPIVRWLIEHPKGVVGVVVAALGFGGFVASTRGAEFIPRLEEGALAIQLTRPPSVSLSEAVQGTLAVERAVLRFPDVANVMSRTGSPDVATDVMGMEQSDVIVQLKPRSAWVTGRDAAGFSTAMEPFLRKALPGTSIAFTQPIEMRMRELIGGVRSDVGVKIFGNDLDELRRIAERFASIAQSIPGSADVRVDTQGGLRLLDLRPEPRRLGRLGVPTTEVLNYVEMQQNGREVGKLREGQRTFDIAIRAEKPFPTDVDSVARIRVPLADGKSVLVGDIATAELLDVPAMVAREKGRRRVTVESNVRGRDLAGFVSELQARLRAEKLPLGYFLEFGGQYENLVRATNRLLLVVPITIGAILLLLYLTFSRLRPALLIFINVPIAAVGGVLALAIRNLDLSMSAAVGFLALSGVATMNGVVLIATVLRHESAGMEGRAAAMQATSDRFRAVLTTALVAALGFVPMAVATGVGAEVQRPLATVVIGGLITSTLATLLLLPALYIHFGGARPATTPAPMS